MNPIRIHASMLRLSVVLLLAATPHVAAQTAVNPEVASPAPSALESLAWLEGCWRGNVNQREFREQWMPLRGAMMLGVTQTVTQGRTQDYAFLRIAAGADGALEYVTATPGQAEYRFRYVPAEGELKGKQFAFTAAAETFPQRIVYYRGDDGWLYASVEGKINGEDKRVTYPMRRIDCASGEVIRK
jgi:hypothetical protein